MTREKREWYENSELHVTARGNNKNKIFKEEKDYQVYLFQIEEAIDYYDNKFQINSFCLMSNHVHLLVQTEDISISDFIKRVNSLYAQKFNEKYDYVGHLFQGRFKSELVDTQQYSIDASRYIHLNPVKAGIVEKPEDYIWSSYRMFIGMEKERLIKSKNVLKHFGDEKISRMAYKEYCEHSPLIKNV